MFGKDAFDTLAMAVVIAEQASMVITYANPAANRLFAYAPDELVGQSVEALMPVSARPRHAAFVANYLAAPHTGKIIGSEKNHGRDVVARRKGGTTFPVRLTLAHNAPHFVAYFTSLENVETDRLAAMRTGVQCQQHDMRHLAQAMKGILSRAPVDAERLSSAVDLLSCFLDNSVFEDKDLEGAEAIDAVDIIQQVVRVFSQSHLRREGVELTCDTPQQPIASLKLSCKALVSMITNAIVNALKATHSGGVSVTISYADGTLHVIVKDSGEGMETNTKQNLGVAHFTTDKTGSNQGLGAFTMIKLCRQLGGSVDVTSERGTGTIVQFAIPATESSSTPPSAPPASATADVSGLKVMVVDDDAFILEILREWLQELGCSDLSCFEDPRAAIACLQTTAFDVVISDMNMGELSGSDVVSALRQAEATARHSPPCDAYILSGDVSPETSFIAAELLTKPIGMEALKQLLESAVGKR